MGGGIHKYEPMNNQGCLYVSIYFVLSFFGNCFLKKKNQEKSPPFHF